MCYSAQVADAWQTYVRKTGIGISLLDFANLYGFRNSNRSIRIPKAVDAAFADPATDLERAIRADIESFNAQQATAWEQELFKQRKRLVEQRTNPGHLSLATTCEGEVQVGLRRALVHLLRRNHHLLRAVHAHHPALRRLHRLAARREDRCGDQPCPE